MKLIEIALGALLVCALLVVVFRDGRNSIAVTDAVVRDDVSGIRTGHLRRRYSSWGNCLLI